MSASFNNVPGLHYMGCYKDGSPNDVDGLMSLFGFFFYVDATYMTVETCSYTCWSYGFTFAALAH